MQRITIQTHHDTLYNKFLLTVGGRQQSDTSEMCVLNPSTGQWKHLTNIPAARCDAAAVGVADNILVIRGLTNKNNEYSNTTTGAEVNHEVFGADCQFNW